MIFWRLWPYSVVLVAGAFGFLATLIIFFTPLKLLIAIPWFIISGESFAP